LAFAGGAHAQPVTFSSAGNGAGPSITDPSTWADPVGRVDAPLAGVADDWLGFGPPIPGNWN
jgi:hypothetical protein